LDEAACEAAARRPAGAGRQRGTSVSNGTIRSSVGAPGGLSCRPS